MTTEYKATFRNIHDLFDWWYDMRRLPGSGSADDYQVIYVYPELAGWLNEHCSGSWKAYKEKKNFHDGSSGIYGVWTDGCIIFSEVDDFILFKLTFSDWLKENDEENITWLEQIEIQ